MRRDKILNRFLIHIYMLILGIEEAIICLKLGSDPRFAFLERSLVGGSESYFSYLCDLHAWTKGPLLNFIKKAKCQKEKGNSHSEQHRK